jgi:hypothetical protein
MQVRLWSDLGADWGNILVKLRRRFAAQDATRVVTQLKLCNFQAPELSSFRPALTATSASRYKKLNCPRRSPVNARFAPDAVFREWLVTAGRRAASNDMISINPKTWLRGTRNIPS